MANVMKVGTNGYRGATSNFVYVPPGEYMVDTRTDLVRMVVSRQLAAAMLNVDKAWIIEVEPEPQTRRAPKRRARKTDEQENVTG